MCHMCTNSVIAILYLHKEREGRETESGVSQRVRERDEETNTEKGRYRQLETDRGR